MQYCVAQGNPFDGVTLYGPFETSEEASEWAESNDGNFDWWIVNLNAPEDEEQGTYTCGGCDPNAIDPDVDYCPACDGEDSVEAGERERMQRKFSPPPGSAGFFDDRSEGKEL